MSAVQIVEAYCDGGLVGQNPSSEAGTWAWCHVSGEGIRRAGQWGSITPGGIGLARVSSNVAELEAAIRCMMALPAGWNGIIYTDSFVTLCRIERRDRSRRPASMRGVPRLMQSACHRAIEHLGGYEVVLLDGHPSKAQLAANRGSRGNPVSCHNVWCDRMCSVVAHRFRSSQEVAQPVAALLDEYEDSNPAGAPMHARGSGLEIKER